MLVKVSIGFCEDETLGKALQAGPFPRCHLVYVLFVYATLDIGCRHHAVLATVDDEIALAAHSSADDCAGYVVEVADNVAEPMTCRFVARLVCFENLEVAVAEVVLRRDGRFV